MLREWVSPWSGPAATRVLSDSDISLKKNPSLDLQNHRFVIWNIQPVRGREGRISVLGVFLSVVVVVRDHSLPLTLVLT
jgi:hypothetical protein